MPRQFVDFNAYIKSEAWKKKSLERFKVDGYVCQMCGSGKNLVCHHITYLRLGNEDIDDLLTVCYSCHKKLHDKDSRKAPEPPKPRTHKCQQCLRELPESEFNFEPYWICQKCYAENEAKAEKEEREKKEDLKKYTDLYAKGEVFKLKDAARMIGVRGYKLQELNTLLELGIPNHYAMTPDRYGRLCSKARVYAIDEIARIKGFIATHHKKTSYKDGDNFPYGKWVLNVVESSRSGLALVVETNEWVRCLPLMDGFNRHNFDNPSAFYDHFLDTASNEEEGTLKEIMRAYHAAYIEKGVRLT